MLRPRALLFIASALVALNSGCAISEEGPNEMLIDLGRETMEGPGGTNGAPHQVISQLPAICGNVATLADTQLPDVVRWPENPGPASEPEHLRPMSTQLEAYHADPSYGEPLTRYLVRLFAAKGISTSTNGYEEDFEAKAFTTFDWGMTNISAEQRDHAAQILTLFINDNGNVPIYVYGPMINVPTTAPRPVMEDGRPRLYIDDDQDPLTPPARYIHEFAICGGSCGHPLFDFHMGADTMDALGIAADPGPSVIPPATLKGATIKRMCPDSEAPCPVRGVLPAQGNSSAVSDLVYTFNASNQVTGATYTIHQCYLSFVPESAIPELYDTGAQ